MAFAGAIEHESERILLEFVGLLLAFAVRNSICLDFDFPKMLWKFLLEEKIQLEDLSDIDEIA